MGSGERVLSEVIRNVRQARGMDQRALGAACAPPRSQSAVAQWENGAHPLTERTLEVVAAALGLSVRELLLEGLGAAPRR